MAAKAPTCPIHKTPMEPVPITGAAFFGQTWWICRLPTPAGFLGPAHTCGTTTVTT